MVKLLTSVTHLLGIDVPIVQAGMAWVSSDARLPLAVSRAGGLGVIAAGPMRAADLEHVITTVRAGTDRPFAVNVPLYRPGVDEILNVLVALRVPVVIASQGGPQRYLRRLQDVGTLCLHVVGSRVHAEKAVAAGVSGLVVVGAEAGGHPPPSMVSTLVNVREIVRALPHVPLIASGGFADGYGLAAGLALGAGAVQFGSRFLLSHEANVHPEYQRAVLDAHADQTRVVGIGLGPIRTLANRFADELTALETAGADIGERRALFERSTLRMAAVDGDVTYGRVEAGQSAGLVNEVKPAGAIVDCLVDEYLAAVARLPLPGSAALMADA